MKLLHISDLHLGKRVYEFSMIKDQEFILKQILDKIEEEQPNAVLLAGDIYDKSVPSAEAVELFDDFLTQLSLFNTSVYIISGNHDSQERLNFGSRIMKNRNIYITGTFDGQLKKETLEDEFGALNLYSMPFLKPSMVRPYFLDQEIITYQDAIKTVIENTIINREERNLLLAHQFVTGSGIIPETSESEMLSLGGVDNVDASLFDDFDYVALGHLHGPQRMMRDTIRYSGSILKYSFSEIHQKKSITLIEVKQKDEIVIRMIPLIPNRDLRAIKGPIEELMKPEIYMQGNKEDYLSVILTNEEPIMDPIGKLRLVYPNIMTLSFENRKSQSEGSELELSVNEVSQKTPENLFDTFYTAQHGVEMSEEQSEIMNQVIKKVMGGEQ